jgi:hypothetical protein
MSCHQWNWVTDLPMRGRRARLEALARRFVTGALENQDVVDDVPVIREMAQACSTFFCSGQLRRADIRRRR